MAGSKVAFLDRDGTINVDQGFVHKVKDWEFVDRSLESLKKLQDNSFALAVVTNQSGIGSGMYAVEDMLEVNRHMTDELLKFGVKIDVIAYCDHARDVECECRKPRTGMLDQVIGAIPDIDFENSWMIGDKEADVLFGQAIGVKTALITSSYWNEGDLVVKPDLVVDSLYGATEAIVEL